MSITKYIFLLSTLLVFSACEPTIEDKTDIGTPPDPSFDILGGSTPNEFTLVNTTVDAFITQWDLGDYGKQEGATVDVIIPFIGTYDVTMTTFNKGGHASLTKTITVTQDDPNACIGNLQLLTNCSEKTWTLLQDEAALIVGPNLTEVWWNNSANDVIDRACHFNDRFTFRESGEFEYDNQGDFWADDDGSGNIYPAELGITVGCHPSEDWPEAFKAWDSGLHAFSLTNNSLTVSGEGAWIGLYKVGTAGEVAVPQSSITYTIGELTADRLVLIADIGFGFWRFTFVPE